MSNSKLVNYTLISPNKSTRTEPITKITIHHMAVVWSVEQCGQSFYQASRKASSNYAIDSDGRVGLYVPEDYRAWTSSSSWNDNKAVTIEVSNSVAAYPWPVSDAAYEKLLQLCTDICMRNGIKELVYTGDKDGSLTRHNMFAATLCPGPYLEERFPKIAEEVNRRIKLGNIYGEEPKDEDAEYKRFCELMQRWLSEPDTSEPSSWAKDSCTKAIERGIFKGDGKGAYNWQKPLTRESYAVLQDREGLI